MQLRLPASNVARACKPVCNAQELAVSEARPKTSHPALRACRYDMKPVVSQSLSKMTFGLYAVALVEEPFVIDTGEATADTTVFTAAKAVKDLARKDML